MLKRVVKSVGAALGYFGIYIACQFIVMMWATLIVSTVLSFQMMSTSQMQFDSSAVDEGYVGVYDAYESIYGEYTDMSIQIAEKTTEILLDYAVHMTAISGVLTLVVYAVLFKIRKKKLFNEVGLRRISVLSVPGMILLGVALNITTTVLLSYIPFPDAWWEQYTQQSAMISDAPLWATVLLSVIIAPVLEEVLFRGLIHTRLKRCMPMLASMIISAWIFGMMHGAIIWLIYASLFGFLLAWVYEKYNSLLAPILLHFGFNLTGCVLEYFETIPTLVPIVAIAVSVLGIFLIQRTSKNKIEFVMPKTDEV